MKGHFGGLGELEFWAPCCGGGEQILGIEDGVRPGTEVGRLWQREGDPFPRREEQFGWAFGCEVFCVLGLGTANGVCSLLSTFTGRCQGPCQAREGVAALEEAGGVDRIFIFIFLISSPGEHVLSHSLEITF